MRDFWRLFVAVAIGMVIVLLLGGHVSAAEPPPRRALDMDAIVITPNRVEQKRSDVAANVTVLTRQDLEQSASQTVDDFLRQVPGFSLFRRSSSLVAAPSTQGVSLRGMGPTATSRALVLLDGVPLNDPFGGWVYWSRIPLESIERVEVVRGGGSGVWGNYALGGVINVLTEEPTRRSVRLSTQGGTRGTVDVDGMANDVFGPLGVSLAGTFFDTDGYEIVREDQRGPIDVEAESSHKTFRGKLAYGASQSAKLFLNGSYFTEDRSSGTPLTGTGTNGGYASGGGELTTEDGSEWTLSGFGQLQSFQNSFSSQASDRSSETPSLNQFDVPSSAAGGSVQWSRRFLNRHLVTGGLDARWIDGETNEDFRFMSGQFTRRRKAGGEQEVGGLYAQDIVDLASRWQLTLAGRGDLWRNAGAFRRERSLEDGSTIRDDRFGSREEWAFSPKVALLHRWSEQVSFRGSFYQGFRAPTLNELVRPFRVRNDITEANAALDPERMLGGEAGADYATSQFLVRFTGFWNEISDPIANVTIGSGPGTVAPCGFVPEGGVCRQKQNLDHARVRGVESEILVALEKSWSTSVSYLFDDAEVTSASAQPDLEGRRIAQVPKHQASARLSYDSPEILSAAVQLRFVGKQFEDDRNSLPLDDFVVVDLFVSRALRPGWEVFLGVENLFDKTYEVGKSADGLVTVGMPNLIHGGLRVRI